MNSCHCWLLTCLLIFSHTYAVAENSGASMRLALGYLPPVNCENSRIGVHCINNQIVERLQHFSGINIQTQIVPYARTTQMLKNNQTDMALILKKNNMPSNSISVAKVYEIKLSVYTRLGTEHLAFSQLRIGVLRGQGSNIIERLAEARLVELNEYRQGVEMLALGRLDALLGPDQILKFLFDQHQLTNKMSARSLLHFNQEVWLYCRQEACDGERLRKLQQAITSIQPEIPNIIKVMPAAYYER